MKILAIDTSARAASVAICEDDFLLAENYINCGFTHSQTIMPMIAHCLEILGLSIGDIDLFGVSAGPGSFTGVRIGIATIKGLALPADKPCVGVSTLHALALNLVGFQGIICPVMDARRNQVYNAIFRCDGKNLTRLCPDRAISVTDLGIELKNFKENIILVGDGADLCYNILKDCGGLLFIAPNMLKYEHASSVAVAARVLYRSGEQTEVDALMPVYLRLPQAERELALKKTIKKES